MTTKRPAKDTIRLKSWLELVYWHLYPVMKDKPFRLEDVHDPDEREKIKAFVDRFLPDLLRMTKPPRAEEGNER